jgi:drug/metabolite transporter (DMT)-like permease
MGILIALGNFGIIKAFSFGAPQSTFTLLFYISLIIYGIIFGLLIWHEKLQLVQVAGILLAIFGVFLAVYPKTK